MTGGIAAFGHFVRHESRLVWRDFLALLAGGRGGRERLVLLGLALFVGLLHLGALVVAEQLPDLAVISSRQGLLVLTAFIAFAFLLMLAQALESVTRVIYARADLDLILSSPAPAHPLFVLRAGLAALSTTTMAMLLAGPFIDAMVLRDGAFWFGAYGLLAAMGATAAALAIGLTLALFRAIGPKRTRLVAQIVAAVIGAGFVIGAQVVGIVLYGKMDRLALFTTPAVAAAAPADDSLFWWPARAALGEAGPLAATLGCAFALLLVAALLGGGPLARHALAAAGADTSRRIGRQLRAVFADRSPSGHLRAKELQLLLRDPWLLSQSLMQILYLLPPAVLLWRSFGDGAGAPAIVGPVVVMAAGQLAGGLAWLAVSGEDAPDLIATAPLRAGQAMRAKVEAVLLAICVPLTPIVALLALADPWSAIVTAGGALTGALAATVIQILFRTRGRRSQFRRRQTASRTATFAEAFSSIGWAAATGLAAAGHGLGALSAAVLSLMVLGLARLASPRHDG